MDGASRIGVDVGGTTIKAGAVDEAGTVVTWETTPTPPSAAPHEIAEAVAALVGELAPSAAPVGVAMPGRVRRGVLSEVVHLDPSWNGLVPATFLQDVLGRPVTTLNDADAAGLAEARFGAARAIPGSVLLLTLGTGVGSALVHDGVLVPGSELGLLEHGGATLDAQVSAAAARRRKLDAAAWIEELRLAVEAINRLLAIDLVVLGGGGGEDLERAGALPDVGPIPMVSATLGNRAGVIGAAFAGACA